MADKSIVITNGIGAPADIPALVLTGLTVAAAPPTTVFVIALNSTTSPSNLWVQADGKISLVLV